MTNNMVFSFSFGFDLATLLIRVLIGGLLVLHGIRKTNNKFQGTINWFNSLGFPFNIAGGRAAAYLAAFNEIVFGSLFVIGFLSQLVAGAIVGQMLVASYVAIFKEKSNLISLTGKPGEGIYGYELDLLYVFGALAIFLIGGGAFSVDGVLTIFQNPIISI